MDRGVNRRRPERGTGEAADLLSVREGTFPVLYAGLGRAAVAIDDRVLWLRATPLSARSVAALGQASGRTSSLRASVKNSLATSKRLALKAALPASFRLSRSWMPLRGEEDESSVRRHKPITGVNLSPPRYPCPPPQQQSGPRAPWFACPPTSCDQRRSELASSPFRTPRQQHRIC